MAATILLQPSICKHKNMETIVFAFLLLILVASISFYIYKLFSKNKLKITYKNKTINIILNNYSKLDIDKGLLEQDILEGVKLFEKCNISKSFDYLNNTQIDFVDFPIKYFNRTLAGKTSFGYSCIITIAIGDKIKDIKHSALKHELGHVILYKDTNSNNQDYHHAFFRDNNLSL